MLKSAMITHLGKSPGSQAWVHRGSQALQAWVHRGSQASQAWVHRGLQALQAWDRGSQALGRAAVGWRT